LPTQAAPDARAGCRPADGSRRRSLRHGKLICHQSITLRYDAGNAADTASALNDHRGAFILTDKTTLEKWSVLAALRFLLASIVAVNHLPEFVPIGFWAVIPKFGAFEAILGFLLISGYSIGASYIKEPEGFIGRRVKRIYPVYLASLALACGVFVLANAAFPPLWELLANVLFLNQIVTSTSLVGPAWSLSLEFWLYCLTPLFFKLSDRALQRLILMSFVAYAAYTCGRTLFHWNYYSGTAFGLNLLLLSFIWLAGLALARNREQAVPMLKKIGLIFAAHILLAVAIQGAYRLKNGRLPEFFQADLVGFLLQACTLTLVLFVFARVLRPHAAARPSAFLRALGDISYPLYLIHIPVYYLLKQAGLASPVLYYGAAVLVSALMYRVLDFYSQRRHAAPRAPILTGERALPTPEASEGKA
jgi:peptidoglycan/LPS O-acetylase OafA/YrhL